MTDGRTILRSRWLLCILLVVGAALFGVGVAAERNSKDEHHATETANHDETTEPSSTAPAESGHNDGDAGEEGEGGEQAETAATTVAAANGDADSDGAAHNETTETGNEASEKSEASEKVLGVDLESTRLVIIAILASLALGAATILKPTRPLLFVVAVFSIGFAVFDVAEAAHQFDVSKPGIAVLAIAIAAVHAAAAMIAIQWTTRPPVT